MNEVLSFPGTTISRRHKMADLAALKAAVDVAQAAQDSLIEERASKRASMVKAEFQVYNYATVQQQKDTQAALGDATEAFQAELKVIRADAVDKAINVAVGTLSESNSPGGAN